MTKVVIANRWTDPAGKVYKGGDVVEVEPGRARDLIARHKARPYVEPETPEPESPVEPEVPTVPEAPAEAKSTARRAEKKEAAK